MFSVRMGPERTAEDQLKILNEKYLKKFIRQFWLQPIPEVCDEKKASLIESAAENLEEESITRRDQMSSSDNTTSKPFHKTHRRLPSYGNVNIIFAS